MDSKLFKSILITSVFLIAGFLVFNNFKIAKASANSSCAILGGDYFGAFYHNDVISINPSWSDAANSSIQQYKTSGFSVKFQYNLNDGNGWQDAGNGLVVLLTNPLSVESIPRVDVKAQYYFGGNKSSPAGWYDIPSSEIDGCQESTNVFGSASITTGPILVFNQISVLNSSPTSLAATTSQGSTNKINLNLNITNSISGDAATICKGLNWSACAVGLSLHYCYSSKGASCTIDPSRAVSLNQAIYGTMPIAIKNNGGFPPFIFNDSRSPWGLFSGTTMISPGQLMSESGYFDASNLSPGTYSATGSLTPVYLNGPDDGNVYRMFTGISIPVTLTVTPPPPPTVTPSADPTSIPYGQSSTLSWSTTNATAVSIVDNNGNAVGSSLPINGSYSVSPTQTTVYTITATGSGGTATKSVTVTVIPLSNYTVSCATTPNSIYSGGSAIFSATATGTVINIPLTYSWSNSSCGDRSSCVVNNITSDITNYVVKISDPYGYVASTTCPSVTIIKNQQPPTPSVSITGGPVFYVSKKGGATININISNAAPDQLITFIPKQIQANGEAKSGWAGPFGNHTNDEVVGFINEAVSLMNNQNSNININSILTDSDGTWTSGSLNIGCSDIGVYRLGANIAGATSSDAVFAVAPDPNATGTAACPNL